MLHTKVFPSKICIQKSLTIKWNNKLIGTIYTYASLLSWYSLYEEITRGETS